MPGLDGSPVSPLRKSAQNNIYVIPAPDQLTFRTTALLAIACCVPAILVISYILIKILKIHWNIQFSSKALLKQILAGMNSASIKKMKNTGLWISVFVRFIEVTLFSAAVLGILILGERNFFSTQVNYQTERLTSAGQWAPMVVSNPFLDLL